MATFNQCRCQFHFYYLLCYKYLTVNQHVADSFTLRVLPINKYE
ncbi:hypothetical protein KPK_2517 [Klebsiella variicola]|uniref:Uncharacterized protein n=1 Tax=Klebsiella variicola (strain 342) TaxID=507522 RepID=B5XX34_KLEV3|nr:hypothetical protein KPK_2517 [Klebsiella variicola]